jgi:hypothetical protein
MSDIIGVQAQHRTVRVGRKDGNGDFDFSFIFGQFIAIECKREKGGKQSEAQARFQKNIENHGGLYVLAKSVDEVEKALGPVMVHIVKERRPRVIPR